MRRWLRPTWRVAYRTIFDAEGRLVAAPESVRQPDDRREPAPTRSDGGTPGPADHRLLVLDCAYTWSALTERGQEHWLKERDLEGYFGHVWHVHPLAGASPTDPGTGRFGPSTTERIGHRHTVVEFPIGRLRRLRRFGPLNLLLAQVLLLVRLTGLMRRGRVSVVAAADPFYTGVLGLGLARLHRVPFAVFINANYEASYRATGALAYARLLRWHWLERLLARFVLARSDLVTVGSADNLDYVLASGGRAERVAFVPSGDLVARVHWQDPAARSCVAEEIGVGSRPYIVFVGRLEPVKHPEDVLAALADLREAAPDLIAVLVGDGSMRPTLERMAGDLGLVDQVRLVGIRSQTWIARAMAGAAVNVCPLSGLALVEAALSGTPTVAYDVEWHGEFLEDGRTGILVPYRDTKALARAIARLLHDPRAASDMGQAGRVQALAGMDREAAFSAKRVAYERLLAPART